MGLHWLRKLRFSPDISEIRAGRFRRLSAQSRNLCNLCTFFFPINHPVMKGCFQRRNYDPLLTEQAVERCKSFIVNVLHASRGHRFPVGILPDASQIAPEVGLLPRLGARKQAGSGPDSPPAGVLARQGGSGDPSRRGRMKLQVAPEDSSGRSGVTRARA
jgi:hypothetical protein